jgi:hypothetical protein
MGRVMIKNWQCSVAWRGRGRGEGVKEGGRGRTISNVVFAGGGDFSNVIFALGHLKVVFALGNSKVVWGKFLGASRKGKGAKAVLLFFSVLDPRLHCSHSDIAMWFYTLKNMIRN